MTEQLKNDIKEFFSNTDNVKQVDENYNGEYSDIIVKERYEKYPKIQYPMITIDEINNEDVQQYFDGTERISYLAYQFEINCEQSSTKTALQNVNYVGRLLDRYLKQDRYRCLRRIGDFAKSPLASDNNVMVGYLRYECNLDVKTNTIYRRY